MCRAVFAGTPGTPSSSSCVASSTRSAEPKCRSSARRRAGPTPSSWSNIDSRAAASRRWRWKVIAKRCASSRIRCRSCSPGECVGQQDRLRAARDEHLLDPLRERDHRDARQVVAPASPRAPPRAAPCRRRSRRGSAWRRTTRSTPRSRDPAREPREAARRPPRASRRSRPARPARAPRTCGSAPSSRRRPRRRPSSRRSPGPGCSRCRSTRSGSAATRG